VLEKRGKQRIRAIKRETGAGKGPEQLKSRSSAQGQRKAIRGNRTRQRQT
jgi:hypothetical protein